MSCALEAMHVVNDFPVKKQSAGNCKHRSEFQGQNLISACFQCKPFIGARMSYQAHKDRRLTEIKRHKNSKDRYEHEAEVCV